VWKTGRPRIRDLFKCLETQKTVSINSGSECWAYSKMLGDFEDLNTAYQAKRSTPREDDRLPDEGRVHDHISRGRTHSFGTGDQPYFYFQNGALIYQFEAYEWEQLMLLNGIDSGNLTIQAIIAPETMKSPILKPAQKWRLEYHFLSLFALKSINTVSHQSAGNPSCISTDSTEIAPCTFQTQYRDRHSFCECDCTDLSFG
jgi:hypothetical protein